MWTLRGLVDYVSGENGNCACVANINGKWVPCRPINWTVRTFRERLREAWAVFKGKADSFTWPEGQ